MLYTTPTMSLLEHAIDASALRQSVYAANVANANVAGYGRLEVSFDSELARAGLDVPGNIEQGAQQMAELQPTTVFPTGQAVKLDEEMAGMAQNALRYQILLNAYQRSIGSLELAINEGRK